MKRKLQLILLALVFTVPVYGPRHVEASPLTKPAEYWSPLPNYQEPPSFSTINLKLPQMASLEEIVPPPVVQASVQVPITRGDSSGNLYAPGWCTWYVKNMRPDLPNNLGNADTWVARAAAQGLPTGYTPRAGAVGQLGMHVVYVQSVNPDGTMNISEMNAIGLFIISGRTVSPGGWGFIY